MKQSIRDNSIDILRAFALLSIILAHVNPSDFWLQVRSFDVPLMVFLSGVCYKVNNEKYTVYLSKRIKRLVIPCWIFLVFWYLLKYIFNKDIVLTELIRCFTLTTGWYLWIFRVFLIIALIAPFISAPIVKLKKSQFYLCLTLTLIINEIISTHFANNGLVNVIMMNVGYLCIYSLGLKIKMLSNKTVFINAVISFIVYVLCAVYLYMANGEYILTGNFKFPPRLYYLSYAAAIICILWVIKQRDYNITIPKFLNKLFVFIGSHTVWIYLFHIVYVELILQCCNINNSFIAFTLVSSLSIFTTYIFNMFIDCMIRKYVINKVLGRNLRIILQG